jgi:hypothetical protein
VENNENVEVIDAYSGDFLIALGYLANGVNEEVQTFNSATLHSKVTKVQLSISNADGSEEVFEIIIDMDNVSGVVLP